MRQAQEDGVDLDEIDGSGADGRITVADVRTPPKRTEAPK